MTREEFLEEKKTIEEKYDKTIAANHSQKFIDAVLKLGKSRYGLIGKDLLIFENNTIRSLDNEAATSRMTSIRELSDRYVEGLIENAEIDYEVNSVIGLSMNYHRPDSNSIYYKDKFLTLKR